MVGQRLCNYEITVFSFKISALKVIAKTLAGLEPVLEQEIHNLGITKTEILRRGVAFHATTRQLYLANYLLRTALRLIIPIEEFRVKDENDLYKKARGIDWSDYMSVKNTFACDAVVNSRQFNHSQYVGLKVKDAIADYFRDTEGSRPSVDKDRPDILVNIHVAENEVTISLDSSGGSLHLRGYRKHSHPAALNEVLAAGIIALSGWDGKTAFADPMCGSGTLLIEAAMIAHQIPAGFFRHHFGFTQWPGFDNDLWQEIRAENRPVFNPDVVISGNDNSRAFIRETQVMLERLKLHEYIRLYTGDFTEFIPEGKHVTVITNPPYNERIRVDDIRQMYSDIGRWLKFTSGATQASILSSNKDALKFIGLKPAHKHRLLNGPLDCTFATYSLYQGSRHKE